MLHSYSRYILIFALIMVICGCSSYQPAKNVWKTTKGLWHSYVSPPASVDYESKGDLPPQAHALSRSMLGIDKELTRLERMMQNADRPPTQEWLNRFFATFPWISGFAGVKYDGTILGQEPPGFMKQLDFNPLLYEDKKQNSRALRADVQPSPLGPEIMLATPLFDGIDFLGIVVAYFDMRSLMQYSQDPQDIVILSPTALLWPGKYDYATTPLAGTDWSKVVVESTAGTCTNANGSFFYMVRFLGNLPLVFAIPEKGNFPEGDGNLDQGAAFFPAEREKLPPPPLPERKPGEDKSYSTFVTPEEEEEPEPEQPAEEPGQPEPSRMEEQRREREVGRHEIQPGSRESLLLKGGGKQGRRVQERLLEGENIEFEPLPPTPEKPSGPTLHLLEDEEASPTLSGGRPSPFGPRNAASEPATETPGGETTNNAPATIPAEEKGMSEQPANAPETKASPDQPASAPEKPGGKEAQGASEQPASAGDEVKEEGPRLLPGGRPSPFGPGR